MNGVDGGRKRREQGKERVSKESCVCVERWVWDGVGEKLGECRCIYVHVFVCA